MDKDTDVDPKLVEFPTVDTSHHRRCPTSPAADRGAGEPALAALAIAMVTLAVGAVAFLLVRLAG